MTNAMFAKAKPAILALLIGVGVFAQCGQISATDATPLSGKGGLLACLEEDHDKLVSVEGSVLDETEENPT